MVKKNNQQYVQNKINYLNKEKIPSELDNKYGYLLENGYYNYQEYINRQASKAQAGDSEALESCLYYFGWRGEGLPVELLGEYYFSLTAGAIDIYQLDKLAFLRLFSTKIERKTLSGKRPSIVKGNVASKKINKISNDLLHFKSKKDILNDLIDLLTLRILKYKPGERTLRKYVYDMFYLYVGDYVQSVLRYREYLYGPQQRISYEEDLLLSEDDYSHIRFYSDDVYYEWEKQRNTIDIFWIMGHTHPYFEDLTKTERLVLRENMYLNNSQEKIANKYGLGRTTIRTNLNNAKKKIEKSINETSVDWLEQKGYNKLI